VTNERERKELDIQEAMHTRRGAFVATAEAAVHVRAVAWAVLAHSAPAGAGRHQRHYGRQHTDDSGGRRARTWFAAGAATATVSAATVARAWWEREQLRAAPPQLPLRYDPVAFAEVWDQRVCTQISRVGTILSRVGPFLARSAYLYYFGLGESDTHGDHEGKLTRWGVDLRTLLVDLGPTFVKFGQMLSIRPDLLPASVLQELQQLCDAVPPFPTAEAIAVVENELGRGAVSRLFEGLDAASTPIAAASLGQVYCCRLRAPAGSKGSGQLVAVKIQRPDMLSAVSLDLHLLRRYMRAVEGIKALLMHTGVLAHRKQFDVEILDSFASASFWELDYEHEAANQERFMRELDSRGMSSTVRVPAVHRCATSRRILTTEWIEGTQLAKSSPATIRRLVPCGVNVFLMQLLDMGFFHSDPHPGNLLVDQQGRLTLIDFGLCAEVPKMDTLAMTSALVNLMKGDVAGLVDDAVNLRFLPEDVDRVALLPALQAVFDEAQIAAEALDGGALKFAYKTSERRQQFKQISSRLNRIFYEFPFVVPEYFALITRALITLEGIAVTGDKDFDIFAASYPYAVMRASETLGWRHLHQLHSSSRITSSTSSNWGWGRLRGLGGGGAGGGESRSWWGFILGWWRMCWALGSRRSPLGGQADADPALNLG
jgi:aarF domain-containing kinase